MIKGGKMKKRINTDLRGKKQTIRGKKVSIVDLAVPFMVTKDEHVTSLSIIDQRTNTVYTVDINPIAKELTEILNSK